jgi:small subunit ribosomal protein S2
MRKIPNAVFVCDPMSEHNAVAEARKLHIPVFGICDTNTDPDMVDYVIPGNDDALRSLTILVKIMADAVVESKGGITEIAYIKDELEEATMKDAVRLADKENAERLAAIRKARAEKQERFEKMQALRKQREESRKAPEAKVEEAPVEEVKAEEKPVEEKPAEKKPAAKKAPAKKAEEK